MPGRWLLLVLFVALAVLLAGVALRPQTEPVPPPTGGDFVLQSADGPVDTRTLRGKVVLITFGYTYCPDICPTTLATLAEAVKQLSPAEARHLAVLFVSVDPERDTPPRLKDYAAFFHPAIVGVTGSRAQVDEAARRYGVSYARHDVGGGNYLVDHSAWTYLVAADGRLVDRIAYGTPAEQITAAVRKQLHQTTSKGTP